MIYLIHNIVQHKLVQHNVVYLFLLLILLELKAKVEGAYFWSDSFAFN